MKCNLKTVNMVRFEELQAGDLFIERGYENTIGLKIEPLYEDACDDADCIEAINIISGEKWLIDSHAECFKLNGELNVEYA